MTAAVATTMAKAPSAPTVSTRAHGHDTAPVPPPVATAREAAIRTTLRATSRQPTGPTFVAPKQPQTRLRPRRIPYASTPAKTASRAAAARSDSAPPMPE